MGIAMRLRGLLLGALLPIAIAFVPSVAHAQRMHCRPNFLRLDECAGPESSAMRERVRSHAVENAVRAESRRIASAERADRHRDAAETRDRERRVRNDLARVVTPRVRVRTPRVRTPRVRTPRVRLDAPRVRIREQRW